MSYQTCVNFFLKTGRWIFEEYSGHFFQYSECVWLGLSSYKMTKSTIKAFKNVSKHCIMSWFTHPHAIQNLYHIFSSLQQDESLKNVLATLFSTVKVNGDCGWEATRIVELSKHYISTYKIVVWGIHCIHWKAWRINIILSPVHIWFKWFIHWMI